MSVCMGHCLAALMLKTLSTFNTSKCLVMTMFVRTSSLELLILGLCLPVASMLIVVCFIEEPIVDFRDYCCFCFQEA